MFHVTRKRAKGETLKAPNQKPIVGQKIIHERKTFVKRQIEKT